MSNWTGKIRDLSTNGAGKAVLVLDIGGDVKVGTYNNAFSDFKDQTLIGMDTPMYSTLVNMSKGKKVTFSGELVTSIKDCFSEKSLTLSGQMKTPDFVFRFSDVSPG